jgi:hypothetical protein
MDKGKELSNLHHFKLQMLFQRVKILVIMQKGELISLPEIVVQKCNPVTFSQGEV